MNNNFLSKNLPINKSENHLWLIDSTENIEEDIKFFIEDQLHDSNQVIFFHELLQNALENIENEEIKLATHHSQFLPLRAKTILAREKFFDTLQILNLIFDAYSKFDQDKFKSQTIVFDMTWIFEAAISSEIIIELEK
ncbi:MAG: hypothetical protein KBC84_04210, partial [Proteobacteria bacterium]|nr:hypothetical protein [Pseudomonadota bacterium]